MLQKSNVHHAVSFGHPDALTEVADRAGRITAAPQAGDGGHAWITPSRHVSAVDQVKQFTLTHHRVAEVESGELNLLRMMDSQLFQEPVVEWSMVFEFEGTDGMGDAFDRVRLSVGEVVGRVDTPGIPGSVMLCVQNAVHDRIPHIEVGRRHIDSRSKNAGTVGEFSCFHALKQVQIFFHRSIAVRAVLARLRQGAAVLSDLFCSQITNIGFSRFNELNGVFIKLFKVVGGIVFPVIPVKSEPTDILLDRLHVLQFLFGRVGVIKSHIADAAVIGGETKVEADGFGMPDMKISIRFRRKSRVNATAVFAGFKIVFNDSSDKIGCRLQIILGHQYGSFIPSHRCLKPHGERLVGPSSW